MSSFVQKSSFDFAVEPEVAIRTEALVSIHQINTLPTILARTLGTLVQFCVTPVSCVTTGTETIDTFRRHLDLCSVLTQLHCIFRHIITDSAFTVSSGVSARASTE